MDRLRKQRAPVRTLITRTCNEVHAELLKDPPDTTVIMDKQRKLERLQIEIRELDEKVKEAMLDADVDAADYEAECEAIDEYIDKLSRCILEIEVELKPKEGPSSPTASEYSTASGLDKKRPYKLPKIEIKNFNGELKEWLGFWSQFEKIHQDQDLHDSDKLQYLVQAMTEGSRAKKLVESYPQSAANYPNVIEALKDRFGDKVMLAEVYVRDLLKFVIKNQDKATSLGATYDELECHLRALETLGVTPAQSAIFLYPMVESSLPVETIKVWQRSSLSGYGEDGKDEKPEDRLKNLMKFLRQEVKGEERLSYVTNGVKESTGRRRTSAREHLKAQEEDDLPAIAGLYVGEKVSCVFCDKPHDSKDCFSAPKMTLEAKTKLVREKKRCFGCLRPGHMAKACKLPVQCVLCAKKHPTVLCPELQSDKKQQPQKRKEDKKVEVSTAKDEEKVFGSQLVCSSEVVLKTLMVHIEGKYGTKRVRALLDDGSHRSYVTRRVAKEVGLPILGEEKITQVVFGGVTSEARKFCRLRVNLTSTTGGKKFSLEALDQEEICGELPRVAYGSWMKKLQEKNVFISDVGEGCPPIDLLIGAKDLARMMTGRMRVISDGLVANETILGWTLMGASPNTGGKRSDTAAMTVTTMQITQASIEQLWSLETIGIRDPIESSTKEEKEAKTREHFLRTVTRSSDGRYCVSLPWIDGPQKIPDNKAVAEKRLQSTTRKLLLTEGLYEKYEKIFTDWMEEGIVEEVECGQENKSAHYLPHRAVLKPESATTPIRPVFDASCKTGRNPSLNDCLEKGPNLLDLIPSILLRFREGRIGVISDIRKAFLMLDVREEDRDYMRFLWWEDPKKKTLRIFRHKRVVFGVNCSPFLLGAVIEYHLNTVPDEEKSHAEKLKKSLYVDNCVTSVDSYEEYDEFREKSTEIMARAKMDLRLWECSSGEATGISLLVSSGCGLGAAREYCTVPQVSSVLGMKWNKEEDWICCDLSEMDIPEKVTKRVVLSTAQKIFDPLGILCPVLLCPKRLLQEAWGEKTGWDDELNLATKKRFGEWCKELHLLQGIRIPRNMTGGVSSKDKWQLHVFCDASKDAYAAVIFLRTEELGSVSVQLLQAKSRVAPIKKTTIPRLELTGCTIAARLADSIRRALEIMDVPIWYWCDSTTALAWIRRNDEWGTFVGNRVREILKLSKAAEWRHVPGECNPADLPSRGCSPSHLVGSRWWEGPEWLKGPKETWPSANPVEDNEEVCSERKKSGAMTMATTTSEPSWYMRHSSYYKNIRIVAWMRRILKRKQEGTTLGRFLHVEEIEDAERVLLRMIQSECFGMDVSSVSGIIVTMDEDGLLRVKTKLLNRDDSVGFRMPLLLPHAHPLVEQLITEEHLKNGHAGVQLLGQILRERFWILQGRRAVRGVISRCVICRRHTSKKVEVSPAALPVDRVRTGRVFETTGVDLAGPLFIKKRKKAWIVIFTCAVYRCVHLEIVKSLSTDAFLEAMQRFMWRRGRPAVVYSDNGTNFVGLVNLWKEMDWERITRESGLHRIEWKLNPPTAAWWGGWWERLVRSIKDVLKRVLGKTSLTFDKLRNVLCETEAYINGRPLQRLFPLEVSSVEDTPHPSEESIMEQSVEEPPGIESKPAFVTRYGRKVISPQRYQ